MAKNDAPVDAPAEVAAEPIKISLNEFCMRLSETVNRPELIGAFAFSERQAGNVAGTSAEFNVRYNEFINKPV